MSQAPLWMFGHRINKGLTAVNMAELLARSTPFWSRSRRVVMYAYQGEINNGLSVCLSLFRSSAFSVVTLWIDIGTMRPERC